MGSILVTPAKLIDSLITTNIKLFFVMRELDKNPVSAGKKVIELNKRRNQLINEIDRNFDKWLRGEEMYPLIDEIKDY